MDTVAQKKWDFLIIPCRGESSLARLVVKTTEELTTQNKVRVLLEKKIDDRQQTDLDPEDLDLAKNAILAVSFGASLPPHYFPNAVAKLIF